MTDPLIIGRYLICDEIGAGGMATVHLGRLLGAAGFSRVVAIKRLHPERAESDKLATMLVDEARIVARIRHPNVATTLDVIRTDGEFLVILEYVHGPSLAWLQARLMERGETMPPRIALRIAIDALQGLHAAHQAKSERGRPLGIVHRDVSPQNILVGEDGVARVLDFGIAKAEGRLSFTLVGEIKGKLRYMSPEQLRGEPVDLRTDVFAAGVVLWEMLAGRRLFGRPAQGAPLDILRDVLSTLGDLRGRLGPVVPSPVEEVILEALQVDGAKRFATADAMAVALAAALEPATPKELALWTRQIAADLLARRLAQIDQIEQVSVVASRDSTTLPESLQAVPPTVTSVAASSAIAPTAPMNVTLPLSLAPTLPVVGRTYPPPALRTDSAIAPAASARPREGEATLMSVAQANPTSLVPISALASEPRRPCLRIAALAALMLVCAGVGAGLMRRNDRDRVAPRAGGGGPPRQAIEQPPPAALPTALPVEEPPPPQPTPALAAKPSANQRRARGPAPPARPSCDPPFTTDRDGVRVPRPECMGH